MHPCQLYVTFVWTLGKRNTILLKAKSSKKIIWKKHATLSIHFHTLKKRVTLVSDMSPPNFWDFLPNSSLRTRKPLSLQICHFFLQKSSHFHFLRNSVQEKLSLRYPHFFCQICWAKKQFQPIFMFLGCFDTNPPST